MKKIQYKFQVLRTSSLIAGLAVSLVFQCSKPVDAAGYDTNHKKTEWRQYTDPRYGIKIEYPSSWVIKPMPKESEGEGVLTISSPEHEKQASSTDPSKGESNSSAPAVYVGFYSYSIENDESLASWTNTYPDEAKVKSKKESKFQQIDDGEAELVIGESEITKYQYVNIRHGDVVWFVWANYDATAGAANDEIFTHISKSFKASGAKGKRHSELSKHSESLRKLIKQNAANKAGYAGGKLNTLNKPVGSLNGNWWAPLLGNYAVLCGSPNHKDSASFAADTGHVFGLSVKAAQDGDYEINGWDTSGYGNLVVLRNNATQYRHAYAHLNSRTSYPYTNSLGRGTEVGKVGNTGTSAVHLHFHVRNSAYQGINLTGMLGFSPNSFYPSSWGNCGQMGR